MASGSLLLALLHSLNRDNRSEREYKKIQEKDFQIQKKNYSLFPWYFQNCGKTGREAYLFSWEWTPPSLNLLVFSLGRGRVWVCCNKDTRGPEPRRHRHLPLTGERATTHALNSTCALSVAPTHFPSWGPLELEIKLFLDARRWREILCPFKTLWELAARPAGMGQCDWCPMTLLVCHNCVPLQELADGKDRK